MRPLFSVSLVALVIVLFSPASGLAQSCWGGKRLPQCRSFWLTESGLRVGTGEGFGRVGSTTTLGLMFNRGNNTALGGEFQISSGGEAGTWRVAAGPRYRWWVGKQTAVELAAGVAFLGEGDPPIGFKGINGHAMLTLSRFISVVAGVEHRSGPLLMEPTSFSIGVRLGSYMGPITAVALGAVGVSQGSD